jgi:hypothetical protein
LARRYGGTAAQQIGSDAARRYGVAAAVLHGGMVASRHQPPSEEDLEAATGAGGEMEVPEVVAALRRSAARRAFRPSASRGTMSINVHEELDQGGNCQRVLKVPPLPRGRRKDTLSLLTPF